MTGKDYYRAPECYIPSSQTCPGLRVQDWGEKHFGVTPEAVDVLMNLRHISRFPCVECWLLSVALCFWIKYLFWMWYTYYTHRTDIVALLLLCNTATLEDGSIHSFMFFFWILSCHIRTPLPKVTPKSSRTQTCPTHGDSWDWYYYMLPTNALDPYKSTLHVGGKNITIHGSYQMLVMSMSVPPHLLEGHVPIGLETWTWGVDKGQWGNMLMV